MIPSGVWSDNLRIHAADTEAQIAELVELFAPAPLIRGDDGGQYIFLRVTDKSPAPSGVGFVVGAVAYGLKGAGLTRPLTIGQPHVWRINNTWDSDFDLELLFSDRHTRTGLKFGSPEHRALLFRVLDPDGTLGLGDGKGPNSIDNVNEGRLISATRDGVVTIQDVIRQGLVISGFSGSPVVVDTKHTAMMNSGELLNWSARASVYPAAFEPGFDSRARRGVGMLCALAKVDVSRAPDAHRAAALQLQAAGDEALESLTYALRIHMPYETELQYAQLSGNDVPRKYDRIEDQVFPMTQQQRFHAVAMLAVEEESLLNFKQNPRGPLGMRMPPGFTPPPMLHGPDSEMLATRASLSRSLATAMVDAAADNTYRVNMPGASPPFEWQYVADPENRNLFRTALIRMAGGSDAPAAWVEDQRRYRLVLSRYLNYWQMGDIPGKVRFVTEIFDAIGWGEPREIIPIVDTVFKEVVEYLPGDWKPGDVIKPNAVEGFALLRTMYNTRPGRTANAIKQRLDGKLNELRKRAQEIANSSSSSDNWPAVQLQAWSFYVEK